MQNQYAGDIGDYVKLALLRNLSQGRKLGVAWYLHPSETHKGDGRHISYLEQPATRRNLDPDLFDGLRTVLNERTVASLQNMKLLDARFDAVPLDVVSIHWSQRSSWRTAWFQRLCLSLEACDVVFADPDNGLVDDSSTRRSHKIFGKQIPLAEAKELATNRTAIIYHHNTRRAGGHDLEVDHWLEQLGPGTVAVRSTSFSCRTFFIMNPDRECLSRVEDFCDRWKRHNVRLHR